MRFILLFKFRKQPTEAIIEQNLWYIEQEMTEGVKILDVYWTLGRYDGVVVMEAKDVATAMGVSIRHGDNMDIETMIAIPAVEARKLVEL